MIKYRATRNDHTYIAGFRDICKAIGVSRSTLFKALKEQREVNGWKVEPDEYEKEWVYVLEWKNEKYEGYANEISERFGTTENTLRTYVVRERLFKKKYKVSRYHRKATHEIKKEKTDYDDIKHLLEIYGNTITIKNPQNYIEKLKNDGINVKATKIVDEEPHYLLEVICDKNIMLSGQL